MALAPIVTELLCVRIFKAAPENAALIVAAPVKVTPPVPIKLTLLEFVNVEENVHTAVLLNERSDAITTGPANVIAFVPVTVWVLVEKVYVPPPAGLIVPLLVTPFLKSKDGLLDVVKLPVFENNPVKILLPVVNASFNVPLFVMVLKAAKSKPAKAKVTPVGIVNALFTVVFPPKVLVFVPLKTKLL